MKTKIFIIALLLFSSICKSQITLEHSYLTTSSTTYLNIINLSNSGYKYYLLDNANHTLKFYNLNHTLWKTITLTIPSGYTSLSVGNISETLFNADALIELSYSYYKYIATPVPHLDCQAKIINENGTVLLTIPNAIGAYAQSTGANGWKLIVTMDSVNTTGVASYDVYSLPGTMPTAILENDDNNIAALSNPYPNPSSNTVTINYQLPTGTNSGEIVFYNLAGEEIKRFQVDNSFKTLELNNSDLSVGTYLYHLETTNDISAAKKMVVIK